MLTDPQSITILATARSLVKIPGPSNGSRYRYQDNDGTTIFELIPTYTDTGKRRKAIIRLNASKMALDPLETGSFVPAQMSVVLTIDFPSVGYSPPEVETIAADMVNYLDTAGLIAKLVSGQT